MKHFLTLSLLWLSLLCSGQTLSRETVLLYPHGQAADAKTVNGLSGAEEMHPNGYLRNVSDSARFEIFLPENNSGIMVLVCPGGGYAEISTRNEGSLAAEWLNAHGIAAAVLTYRLPNGHDTVPMEDVHKTLRYLRAHSSELGVHTIGIFGASAGGHLAATASYKFDDAQTRPDFAVLFYPVITMADSLTDAGTKRRLIGENPAAALVEEYSAELQVTANTPDTYIILSADDRIVAPANSALYADALKKAGVPVEMHVLPEGGHGWGFAKGTPELERSLAPWLLRPRTSLDRSKAMILEDPRRASNYFHSYEAPAEIEDTPAPEGYKPFYISHIGRHGSRYNSDLKQFDRYLGQLYEYKRKWGFTAEGKKLAMALEDLYDANQDNLEQLSDLGREEHKGISRRMQARFPEVFSNPYRKTITANSTGVKRVKDSREAFLSEIEGFKIVFPNKPQAVSGNHVDKELASHFRDLENRRYKRAKTTDLASDMTRLVKKTFKKPEEKFDKGDIHRLFAGLFSIAGTRQCIAFDSPALDSYFTPEEAYTFWYESNTNVFQSFCISAENEGEKVRSRAVPILESIIEDADAAIRGNNVAADLRFSHDTFIQPLLALIGAEGNTYSGTAGWANSHFCAFTSVPMAVNLQMVFYRSETEGSVLVKLLHNEREVLVPAIHPVSGVYYRWEELREYLSGRLQK